MKKIKLTSVEIIITVSALFVLVAPWLFTRSLGFVSFKDTGTIGDTIGGITAPITSLLGAFLVYKALKAQIDANKLIFEQFEHQKEEDSYKKLLLYATDLIKMLREDINDFEIVAEVSTRISFTRPEQKEIVTYRGVEAIAFTLKRYSKDIGHHKNLEEYENAYLGQIQYFLGTILYLIRICTESHFNDEDKDYLLKVIMETYRSKLYFFLKKFQDERSAMKDPCKDCNHRHEGLPEYIYSLYDEINTKLYPFLTTPIIAVKNSV